MNTMPERIAAGNSRLGRGRDRKTNLRR